MPGTTPGSRTVKGKVMSKKKWSYKTVHFESKREGLLGGSFLDEAEIEEQLNEFGHSGWELISVIEVQDGIIAFFKQLLDLGLPAAVQGATGYGGGHIHRVDRVYQAGGVHNTVDGYQADEVEDIDDPYDAGEVLEVDDVYGQRIYEADDTASAKSESYEQEDSLLEEEEFVDREDRGYETSLSADGSDGFIDEAQEELEDQDPADDQLENGNDRGIGAIRIE